MTRERKKSLEYIRYTFVRRENLKQHMRVLFLSYLSWLE